MSIALAKNYTDLLDEVFKLASVTAELSGDIRMTREGENANEILYPEIETKGLGNYSRTAGYPDGGVDVAWKTAAFNYDRGVKMNIDSMDNQETFDIAAGKAGATLQRTRVAPEADAFTFATLAGLTGVTAPAAADLANAAAFMAALRVAVDQMDNDEVPAEERYLYATPTLINSLEDLDLTKSRRILDGFAKITKVPKTRFISAIDLLSGRADDSYAGHYVPASGAKWLNFMIIYKPCLIKYDKHVVGKLISPDDNQSADAYLLKYRKYGIVDAYYNQRAGIYVHTSNTAASFPSA